MDTFKYCGACLVTDVKMYDLTAKYTINNKTSSTLGHIFSRLLQIPKFEKSHYVCFECTRLMFRFQEFKTKCQKAQSLLANLRKVQEPETVKKILQNVDRKLYKLTSNLTFSYVITTNSTHNIDDLKPVDVKPNENMDIKKEVSETKITTVKKVDSNEGNEESKNVLNLNTTEAFDTDNDNQSDEDTEDAEESYDKTTDNDCDDENNDDEEKCVDNDNKSYFDDDDESDNVPTEYIHYLEDSHDSDNSLLTTENTQASKAIQKPNITKRPIEEKIYSEDEDDSSDDEPLSKVFKSLNEKNVNQVCSKTIDKLPKLNIFEGFGTIVKLTPEDAKKELLLRKESPNYKMSLFKCHFCFKGFESKNTYDNHMIKHTARYAAFKCDICLVRFKQNKYLSKHYMDSHQWMFSCKLCSYKTYSITQAKSHIKLHNGEGYPCTDCGKLFSAPSLLLSHRQKKHLEFVCELCESIFLTSRQLYDHKKRTHWQQA